MIRKISILLLVLLLVCSLPSFAYADDFDFERVFGDFENYKYDKFDRQWSVFNIYSIEDKTGNFGIGFKSFGVRGGTGLSETDLLVYLSNTKGDMFAPFSAIDFLIDDIIYSYNNLSFDGKVNRIQLGENGNLLIEALASCDPTSVSIRLKNKEGKTASIDLDSKQVNDTLKRFCAVYVLNHVWDYVAFPDEIAKYEANCPLYIEGKLADYSTMHKDINFDELNTFLTSTQNDKTTSNENNKVVENSIYAVGNIGDSYIELTNWELRKDYEGQPVIVLTYIWTNNSKDTTMASLAVSVEAYQNGVGLDKAIILDGVDLGSSIKNVRPGYSLEVQEAFKLSDTNSDVEFEVKNPWDIFGSSEPLHTVVHLS